MAIVASDPELLVDDFGHADDPKAVFEAEYDRRGIPVGLVALASGRKTERPRPLFRFHLGGDRFANVRDLPVKRALRPPTIVCPYVLDSEQPHCPQHPHKTPGLIRHTARLLDSLARRQVAGSPVPLRTETYLLIAWVSLAATGCGRPADSGRAAAEDAIRQAIQGSWFLSGEDSWIEPSLGGRVTANQRFSVRIDSTHLTIAKRCDFLLTSTGAVVELVGETRARESLQVAGKTEIEWLSNEKFVTCGAIHEARQSPNGGPGRLKAACGIELPAKTTVLLTPARRELLWETERPTRASWRDEPDHLNRQLLFRREEPRNSSPNALLAPDDLETSALEWVAPRGPLAPIPAAPTWRREQVRRRPRSHTP